MHCLFRILFIITLPFKIQSHEVLQVFSVSRTYYCFNTMRYLKVSNFLKKPLVVMLMLTRKPQIRKSVSLEKNVQWRLERITL